MKRRAVSIDAHRPDARVLRGSPDARCRSALWHVRRRISLEIDEAVFRDDIHHVGARRGHDVAVSEAQHNPAAAGPALVIGGGEANERLAASRRIGAAHELQPSAGAADVTMAVGFGSGLTL